MLWLLLACADDRLLVQKGQGAEGEDPAECWDGIDNDDDGYVDCDDQDCLIYAQCLEEDTGNPDTDTPVDTGDTIDTNDTSDTNDTQDTSDPNDQDGDGYTTDNGDCDDNDAQINPGSADSTVDGLDQNCDGTDGPDQDGDGFVDSNAGGTDCNDLDASINPSATDTPDDNIDQDCDGVDETTLVTGNTAAFNNDGEHTFTVPGGVYTITAGLWGAGGAGGEQLMATGGGGGYVETIFSVTPGETLNVYVGKGGRYTGSGGGASAIMRGSTMIAIAGAGGGGASDGNSGNSWAGGAGGAGGAVGEDGMDLMYHQLGTTYSYCEVPTTGGTGATQFGPGIGGIPTGTAESQGLSRLCYGADGASLEGGGATGVSSQCNFVGPYFWDVNSPGGANGHPGSGGAGYFGGGGGGHDSYSAAQGYQGAVRLIWGETRAFPATLTADVTAGEVYS